MALETNSEAYFPVFLSLIKLWVRSIWYTLTGGTEKSLTLWGAPSYEGDDQWSLGKAREEFRKRWSGQNQLDGVNEGGEGKTDESGGFVDVSCSVALVVTGELTAVQDGDSVQWARDRKREDIERAQAEHDADGGFGPEDFFDSAMNRPGNREGFDRDDALDDLIFMAVLFGILGVLIFLRTQYVAQAEGQQRAQEGNGRQPGQQQ